ncbi:tripartite tricarboxylate transporter substrate binding protein [Acuticoccus sp. MNP-M23]|uniref:Bug family tripartite tricarboxylate transporter substrate binding protein n=1 Tax=Acuticoccus sp. MNP-M23 TaxID=3072793 RepID=UPI002815A2A8|nr:tripartite tricarboxylate transporter substrate binding protein [Acuticoccus sp. MNP-M23]WMS44673.1 tripartite tricarboxylate transporter substrate binding protein [Acuticoccus sp. MNP-M23]
MKTPMMALALAAALGTTAFTPASAQEYPASDVKVMQGFKAGGGSDALAQLVQPFLAEELGVNFVNEYIPGATGAIAWTRLAKQTKADGATISITNTPMLTTNYIMNPAITYNISEITPIANIVTDPGIAVVSADSPFNTFEDFVEAAKANPSTVTVGNSGVGGDDYFTSVQFERQAGVKLQKVPFQGDGPSWTAAMGGKIDASFTNVGVSFPQIKEGNLKALAVFAEERIPDLPDVPTAKELGYDLVAGSSRGYSGPAGFPAEARQQMIDAMQRVVDNPDFQKAAADRAFNIDFISGDDYAAMLQKQEGEYKVIWADIKDEVQKQ